MTQKEALKNLLQIFDNKDVAKLFIYNWLEDINWHSEASKFEESFNDFERQEMELLKDINIVFNPSTYDYTFVDNFINAEENKELVNAVKEAKEKRQGWIDYSGFDFSISKINEFNKAETLYTTFNYIFGWGTSEGWTSQAVGQKFVEELLELVEDHYK